MPGRNAVQDARRASGRAGQLAHVSMPYGMSVMGIELMREYFVEHRSTLGELLLEAKRGTLHRSRGDATALLLDTLARVVNPRGTDLAAERAEHLALFNLLGDPAAAAEARPGGHRDHLGRQRGRRTRWSCMWRARSTAGAKWRWSFAATGSRSILPSARASNLGSRSERVPGRVLRGPTTAGWLGR